MSILDEMNSNLSIGMSKHNTRKNSTDPTSNVYGMDVKANVGDYKSS